MAKLRNRYLGVYAFATFGDWIQGGYLYALYAEYGYSMGGIAALFVVGYGAAATVGTYVGAVGDVHGHRTNCDRAAASIEQSHCEPVFGFGGMACALHSSAARAILRGLLALSSSAIQRAGTACCTRCRACSATRRRRRVGRRPGLLGGVAPILYTSGELADRRGRRRRCDIQFGNQASTAIRALRAAVTF